MARGVRKTPAERLQGELAQVQASIEQYENSLEMMKSKETELLEQIRLEQLKEIGELLRERNLSIEDLKELLSDEEKVGIYVCQKPDQENMV